MGGRGPDLHSHNQAYHSPHHTHSQAYHPHPHTQNPYHHYKSDELQKYSNAHTQPPPPPTSGPHYTMSNGPYSNYQNHTYNNTYFSSTYRSHTPSSSYHSPSNGYNHHNNSSSGYLNGGSRVNGSSNYQFQNHYDFQDYHNYHNQEHNYHNQDYATYSSRNKSPSRGFSDGIRSDGSTPGDIYQQFSDSEVTVTKVTNYIITSVTKVIIL